MDSTGTQRRARKGAFLDEMKCHDKYNKYNEMINIINIIHDTWALRGLSDASGKVVPRMTEKV